MFSGAIQAITSSNDHNVDFIITFCCFDFGLRKLLYWPQTSSSTDDELEFLLLLERSLDCRFAAVYNL